jgi:hypothetical protein
MSRAKKKGKVSDDSASPTTGLPTLITPMPLVWARTPCGQVWWNVQADRWILNAAVPENEELCELWVGALCDEHGFEGAFAGIAETIVDAFAWVCQVELREKMN